MKKLTLGLFLLVSLSGISQTRQDTIALIEKAMQIYLPEKPGAQLSIEKNGKIIFSKAYGSANLEQNIPLTLNSKIEAGSVSKQFTAAAILLLEQQGKLSLMDDVRKYIPELREYGTTITLEHMMYHTSGLKDWGAIASVTGWGRFIKNYTNDDVLDIVMAQKTLNNIPGAEYIYSNSNYNLLAIVVARVSGLSLAEFTKQHIFLPAGMQNTQWRDDHNSIVKDRAIAYARIENDYRTEMPYEDAYGNGGLLTTTEDLLKWVGYYQSGKFGTPSLLSRQIQTQTFNNGKRNNYAAGLIINAFKGHRTIEHNGATAGYRAELVTFPDLNLSIAFLSNTSAFDHSPHPVVYAIRNIFVSEKDKPQKKKKEKTVKVSETLLNTYVGWYKNNRSGAGVPIEMKDKKLLFDKSVMVPQSKNKFKLAQALIEINGQGSLFAITETDTIPFSKVDPAATGDASFVQHTGKYFSTETNSTLTILQKEGKLWMSLKPNQEYPLSPTYRNAFNISTFGGDLYFIKNTENQTVGMNVSVGRARNLSFVKVK